MSVLSKILAGRNSSESVSQEHRAPAAVLDPPANARPSSPCPAGHPLPYGQTWWLDAYGSWHCLDCSPPICDAQVKEHVYVGGVFNQNHAGHGDVSQQPTQADFCLAPGFEIQAIQSPVGVWAFAPETTQAKRLEMVDNVAWFDRMDASEIRRSAKNKK
jgi:hypothetical protein